MEPIVRAALEKTSVRTSTGLKFFFSRDLNTNDNSLILTTSGQHGKQWKLWWTNFILASWKHLELEEPRDDYREFLELSAFISQRCFWSCKSNASPHASGTLQDGQSYLRDKDVLVPWPNQIDNARTKWSSLYSLSVLIHLRAWMVPVVVPLNDFRPTV